MQGFVLSEQAHVAPLLFPVNATGGKTAVAFSVAKHHHASIIIMQGVAAAAITSIVVNRCTKQDGTGATAMPFNVYKAETADVDSQGSRVAVTAAGFQPSANADVFYVIEIDATELADGYSYIQVVLANGANSAIYSAVAVLSGPRYAGVSSPTVLV